MTNKYKYERIQIVTSKDVKEILIRMAKEKKMTLSAFLLQKALGNLK